MALACVVVLAGCASPSDGPDPSGKAASGPAVARWIDTGFTGTETQVAFAPSGSLFYSGASEDADGFQLTIHRSRDGGATWQDVTPRLPTGDRMPPESLAVDPILTVDPDTGRLFFASMFPADVCGMVHASDDEGDTWVSSPLPCLMGPPFDHPFIVTAKPRGLPTFGYPNLVHLCFNQVYATPCVHSQDGGLTWVLGAPPYAGVDPSADGSVPGWPTGVCGGLAGPVRAAPDGLLFVPREYCGRPYVAISADDGLSWELRQVSDSTALSGPNPNIDFDPAGVAYYVWADAAGVLWLATSDDGGTSWATPRQVSPAGVTAHLPTVTAGEPGQVAIGFLGTHDLPEGFLDPDFALNLEERPAQGDAMQATWHAWMATTGDAFGGSELEVSMVSEPERPLIRGRCDPRYCPGGMSDYNGAAYHGGGVAFSFVHWCPDRCATPEGTEADVRNDVPGKAHLAVARPFGT